jgi:pilus assembly protein Flp/PilA
MQALWTRAQQFVKSEDGPTATEYAVMLALIVVVALTAIQTLGTSVQGIFTDVNDGIAGGG